MGAPRLSPDEEEKRGNVVTHLDKRALRKDASLRRVAQAVQSICDVPIAHVSLMESNSQCVVGHVGFSMDSFDRDKTFCAYTVAENEITVVEDAREDERFNDLPFVRRDPGIAFYVGLPLIVGNVPVGTLCAIDIEPSEFPRRQRSELFGLVNALESHLSVIYHHGPHTAEHGVSSKLTGIRALATRERYHADSDGELHTSLRGIEAESQDGFDMLIEMPTTGEVDLSTAKREILDRDN